jgi:Zn-dependent protease/predicted transcriptional regulator
MNGFRLGSVIGFDIRIDFSWFIIFFLILWSFTMAVFPAQLPGLPRNVYVIMGLSGALLFFISLLLHELSHSVVARAKGIRVEGITLFLFGGVAQTKSEAKTAGDEFKIAVIGPVTSIALGLLFAGAAALGARAGMHPAIIEVARYLSLLNVVLAVFNLLPGFPLDGGRVLRALVWKFTGDITRATRMATGAGQALGYLLVAFGLWQVFTTNLMSGLWLVLIGWFLRNAALGAYRQHLTQEALLDATARETMTAMPETVPPDITLEELASQHFLRRRFVAFPVAEGDVPLGIVTLHQLKEVPREEWPQRTARDVMTPAAEPIVVPPDESLLRVAEKLRESPVRRVLVVRDGRLEGIITASDIAGWVGKTRLLRQNEA